MSQPPISLKLLFRQEVPGIGNPTSHDVGFESICLAVN